MASRLGLDFPEGRGFKTGLMWDSSFSLLPESLAPKAVESSSDLTTRYPIRRLIATGSDSPENYAILLGPGWEQQAADIIAQTRLEVLLCPQPESASHIVAGVFDEGSPYWTPRGPNAREIEQMNRIRNLSRAIRKDEEAEPAT